MLGHETSLPFTDLFRPRSWQRVPNYDESLIPGRNLSKPRLRDGRPTKNFHLIPSSNGWKVFLWGGRMGKARELYYVWNSPIFIVVIGWEMIESSCVTSTRRRREGREIVGDMKSEEKLFRLNSIREIIFLLSASLGGVHLTSIFFSSPVIPLRPPSVHHSQLLISN